MTRRQVLFSIFLLPVFNADRLKIQGFWVEYTCDVRVLGGCDNFFELQKRYEKTEDIIAFNREMRDAGKMIGFEFDTLENGNILRWRYGFSDREALESWERELHKRGLVVQHDAYQVHRAFISPQQLLASRLFELTLAKA